MTVAELTRRFPEIPADLHREPLLERFAATFGPLLAVAREPSPCAQRHDAPNHYYLKLIGPLSIYRFGLSTRDRVLARIRALLDAHDGDPEGFARSLLPDDVADAELRGPGCG